jgi:molybdate transport system substrate-binding protein
MTVKVLASNGVKSAIEALAPAFERSSGHRLSIGFGLGAALKRRIEAGEAFDLAILTAAAVDELAKQGRLDASSRASLARSGVGIGIKQGAPRADIGSREALERTLLAARSITWAREGVGGVYFAALLERMGITARMKPKIVPAEAAVEVGRLVVEGKAQYGVILLNELLDLPGVEVLGPLPPEVQGYTVFLAGVGAGSGNAPAARALIDFLRTPSSRDVFQSKGQEPV